MKKILYGVVIFLIFVSFVGCSNDIVDSNFIQNNLFNNEKPQDIFSNTIWVLKENPYEGFEFTDDGYWYMWKIIDDGDGGGEIFGDSLEKYQLDKNKIKFFNFNMRIEERIIVDAEFEFKIEGNLMSLECEYNVPTTILNRIDTSLQEYGKTLGLSIAVQGME
jgi:hypothetical protein